MHPLDSQPILPGSTLGVLGSGQLGRMFAQAAARMGYRIYVFSPEVNSPAGEVAYRQIVAPYADADAVAEFAREVDVVTLEFENIPVSAVEAAARHAPVRPAGSVLHVTQDRLREKTFLRDAGLPCTPFAPVDSPESLAAAVEQVGLPGVLKTSAWGYDGKGQSLVDGPRELEAAWDAMDRQPAVLEKRIDFQTELSVIVARSPAGREAACGPIRNDHANHILDVSTYPAPELAEAAPDALEIARAVAAELDAVGLICIEMFLTREGRLLVNEIAPRTHNSGHLTIDGCAASQFEQQVRAICGLPLGSFDQIAPAAAMANLLGDLWVDGEPHWAAALSDPRLRLHLYGKTDARPGRKMGHLTALADTPEQAAALVRKGRAALTGDTQPRLF